MNAPSFKLYRAIWFNSSNVCKCIEVQKGKLRTFTSKSCSDGKEMYKKAWYTCKVFVAPVAFLRPQQGFQIWYLGKWIFTGIERELHVSTPYEFLVKLNNLYIYTYIYINFTEVQVSRVIIVLLLQNCFVWCKDHTHQAILTTDWRADAPQSI